MYAVQTDGFHVLNAEFLVNPLIFYIRFVQNIEENKSTKFFQCKFGMFLKRCNTYIVKVAGLNSK